MKLIGMQDAHGREIWEGDIRREELEEDQGDDRYYYVCMYIPQWARYAWVAVEHYNIILHGSDPDDVMLMPNDQRDDFSLDADQTHLYYICGNVYENPGLLSWPPHK